MIVTAHDIVRAKGGTWHGTWGAIPGPEHSTRDRSTTVHDRDDGKGVVINSFVHDWREVREDLKKSGVDLKAIDLTSEERDRARAERRRREVERDRIAVEIARRCQAEWDAAPDADPAHPYLVRKRIGPHQARQDGRRLLLPVFGPDTRIMSLQRIAGDGSKLFTKGARFQGGWLRLGDGDGETVVIAEGFATGATIAEVSGLAVIVAFTANNLVEVARWAAHRLIGHRVLVAADHDNPTRGHPMPGGPGVWFATMAATACGGRVIAPATPGDWNDHGADAVRAAFAG